MKKVDLTKPNVDTWAVIVPDQKRSNAELMEETRAALEAQRTVNKTV